MDHQELQAAIYQALNESVVSGLHRRAFQALYKKLLHIAVEYHETNPYVVEKLGPPEPQAKS